jgi:hypothetical protein
VKKVAVAFRVRKQEGTEPAGRDVAASSRSTKRLKVDSSVGK